MRPTRTRYKYENIEHCRRPAELYENCPDYGAYESLRQDNPSAAPYRTALRSEHE